MFWDKDEIFSFLRGVLEDATCLYSIRGLNEIYLDKDCTIPLLEKDSCKILHGCDKVVLIPDNYDFVIKIPFTGVYDSEELAECHSYDSCNDENTRRTMMYQSARELFLENYFVGFYNGVIPIYIQEKVKVFNDWRQENASTTEVDYDLVNRVFGRSMDDCMEILEDKFCYDIIQWYGEDVAKVMFGECAYFDDLHDENYGYLSDGRPVIFDYAEWED